MKGQNNKYFSFNDFDIKLMDAVPDGMVGINDKKEIILFNKEAEVLFGYQRAEMIGEPLERLIPGDAYKKLVESYLVSSRTRQLGAADIDLWAKTKNGDVLPVDISLSYVDTPEGKIAITAIRDITEEKTAKRLLQDTDDFSNGVLNSLISHVGVIDNEGTLLAANDAWKDFHNKYGQTNLARGAIGENCFMHCDAAAKAGDEYAAEVLTGTKRVLDHTLRSFTFEYPCDTADGRLWFLFKAMPFERYPGKIVVSHQDITQAKESEISLKSATSQLEYIFNTLENSFWGADVVNNKMLYVSPGNEKVYGYSEEEFKNNGDLWLEVIIPEDKHIVNASYPELAKGHSIIHEHRIRRKNGDIIWVEARMTPTMDEMGNMIRLDGITLNINDRKKAENDLLQAKQSYQLVVENINDGLMIDDVDGNVTYANDRFYELFGLTGGEDEKIILEDYVAPEYRKLLRERHDRRIAGEEVPDIFQYEGLRKDGTRRWFEVRVTRIEENGIAKGTQSAIRDITERKHAEQLLKDQNTELKKVNSELDRFVYSTSHDLRAPLLSMLGLINLCAETEEIGELREYVKMMKDSVLRADEAIKNIMSYSKNSRVDLQLEYLDMGALISNLVNDIRYMTKAQKISFRIDIKDHKMFCTDKLRISNVINNLVANAVNYCDDKKQPPYVKITFSSTVDTRIITVEDNGEGIPVDRLDRIFEMFYRNSNTSEGSGLGLFICKEIVDKMQGRIDVSSEVGKGTVFTITLPDNNPPVD